MSTKPTLYDTAQRYYDSFTKRKILSGLATEYGLRVLVFGLDALRLVLLARFLDSKSMGAVATVFVIIAFISPWGTLGGREFIARKGNPPPGSELSSILLFVFFACSILCIACIVSAPLLTRLFSDTNLPTLLVFGCLLIFQSFIRVAQGAMERDLDFFRARSIDALRLFVTNVLLLLGSQYSKLLTPVEVLSYHSAGIIFAAIASLYILRARISSSIEFSRIKPLLAFSWPLLISGVVSSFVWQGDSFMVRYFCGNSELGGYEVAYNLPRFLTRLFGVAGIVILPILARLKNDKVKVEGVFSSVNYLIAIVLLPATATLIVFSEQVVNLLFGTQWLKYSHHFATFFFAFVTRAVTGYHWTLLPVLYDKTHLFLIGNLLNSAILGVFGFILIPAYGSYGGALTNIVVVFVAVIPLRLWIIKNELGHIGFLRKIVVPICFTVMCGLIANLMQNIVAWPYAICAFWLLYIILISTQYRVIQSSLSVL